MELAPLLEEAKAASPTTRIQWRDRIAAYGSRAIDGVVPWLADPVLAAFAVRVIAVVGANGDPAHATEVLRFARHKVPAPVKEDVDWALRRLRPSPTPPPAAREAERHTPRRTVPPRQEALYTSAPGRRRTRRSPDALAR